MPESIPEPPEAGIVNGLRFATRTLGFLRGIQARYEDAARIPLPGRSPIVVVTDPTLAHDVLSRPAEFGRVPAGESAALIAERGLVQSEGDLWRQQRAIMAPAFVGQQVETYANTSGRRVGRLAARWADEGSHDVDLHAELTALTVRAATEVLMGEDIGADRAARFHEWMATVGREFEFGLDVVQPDWLPERLSPEFRRAAGNIRGLAAELVEDRRAALEQDAEDGRPPDLLTMLLRAEDQPEVEYPPNQIRDEIATLLIAGHETTALSITYTLALLSRHPGIRERVREEARRAFGDGPPTHADVEDLPFTGRVYREALRLYPPAWAVFRRANGEVRLGEYAVEEGSAVVVPQWSIHRDDRYFADADAFDPDRWAERDPDATGAYFPFSTGPHACVGRSFALSGATLAVARLVGEFDVDVPPGELDDLRVTPTLRPVDGVSATVSPVDGRDGLRGVKPSGEERT